MKTCRVLSSVRGHTATLGHISRKLSVLPHGPRWLGLECLGDCLIHQPFPRWPAAAFCSPRQKNASPQEQQQSGRLERPVEACRCWEEPSKLQTARSSPVTQTVILLPKNHANFNPSHARSSQQYTKLLNIVIYCDWKPQLEPSIVHARCCTNKTIHTLPPKPLWSHRQRAGSLLLQLDC